MFGAAPNVVLAVKVRFGFEYVPQVPYDSAYSGHVLFGSWMVRPLSSWYAGIGIE
jgi:hypothetical protein